MAGQRARRLAGLGVALAVAAGAAVLLVARHRPPPPSHTVRVWYGWSGSVARVMQELIAEYNRTHPQWHVVGLSGVNSQQLLTGIASGSPPDLAELDYHVLGEWAQAHWLEPLDPYLKKARFPLGEFLPVALQTGRYRGRLYGLPFLEDVNALYYNRAMLAAAHLPPPRSPYQLAEEALRLTRWRRGRIVQLGFDPVYPGSNLSLYIRAFGGHEFNRGRTRITPHNPGVEAAISWEAQLVRRLGAEAMDQFQAGAGLLTRPGNAFAEGKLAFVVAGEWLGARLQQEAPHLSYGVEPFPSARGPARTVVQGGVWVLPHGAANPEGAVQFLRWLDSPAVQARAARLIVNLPTTRGGMGRSGLLERYPYLAVFRRLQEGKAATADPNTLLTGTYEQALASAETQVVQGRWSLRQALDRVAKYQKFLDKKIAPIRPLAPTAPLGFALTLELVTARPPRHLVLQGTGVPLYVDRSPETFHTLGLLYRDRMQGVFRTYSYHVNGSGQPVRLGLAFTNEGSQPVTLYSLRKGVGLSPYPDVAGDLALKAWWADRGHTVRAAVIPPHATVYLLHPVKVGETSCVLQQWKAVTGSGESARVVVTAVALPARGGLPQDPAGLPVVPHDANPRGVFSRSDRVGRLVLDPWRRSTLLDVGNIPTVSGGRHVTPGEYEIGVDRVDHRPVINDGNFGVMYHLDVRLANPTGHPYQAEVLVQNLGGGGHYIARLDGVTRMTRWMWFYQSYRLGTLTVPPGGRDVRLSISVPGGATAPERLYFVKAP